MLADLVLQVIAATSHKISIELYSSLNNKKIKASILSFKGFKKYNYLYLIMIVLRIPEFALIRFGLNVIDSK